MEKRKRKKQVRWDQNEIIQLGEYVFDEILKNPTAPFLAHCKKAQNVLLAEGRRKIITGTVHVTEVVAQVQKHLDGMAQLKGDYRMLQNKFDRLKAEMDDVKNETIPVEEAADWLSDQDILDRAAELSDQILEELPLEKVIGFAAEKLSLHLLSGKATISTIIERKDSSVDTIVSEPKALPIVRIYGPRNDQTMHFKKKNPGYRIYTDDCEKSRPSIGKADLVIVWTRHIDHPTEDIIFNEYPREIIRRACGGMTDVNNTINEYFESQL